MLMFYFFKCLLWI